MNAQELYERDDLPEHISTQEAHRQRLARQFDAEEIDGEKFRLEDTATRKTLDVLREALAIRRGETEPTPAFTFKKQAALDAIRMAKAPGEIDAELRDLLGGGEV